MRTQALIDAFGQLIDVAFVSQLVEGGQTDVLGFQQRVFDDLLVMLCDVEGSEFASSLIVVGQVALVVE